VVATARTGAHPEMQRPGRPVPEHTVEWECFVEVPCDMPG
jgi:hypothetical protein